MEQLTNETRELLKSAIDREKVEKCAEVLKLKDFDYNRLIDGIIEFAESNDLSVTIKGRYAYKQSSIVCIGDNDGEYTLHIWIDKLHEALTTPGYEESARDALVKIDEDGTYKCHWAYGVICSKAYPFINTTAIRTCLNAATDGALRVLLLGEIQVFSDICKATGEGYLYKKDRILAECGICKGPYMKPGYQCSYCGTRICPTCIEKDDICPVCQHKIQES